MTNEHLAPVGNAWNFTIWDITPFGPGGHFSQILNTLRELKSPTLKW